MITGGAKAYLEKRFLSLVVIEDDDVFLIVRVLGYLRVIGEETSSRRDKKEIWIGNRTASQVVDDCHIMRGGMFLKPSLILS